MSDLKGIAILTTVSRVTGVVYKCEVIIPRAVSKSLYGVRIFADYYAADAFVAAISDKAEVQRITIFI